MCPPLQNFVDRAKHAQLQVLKALARVPCLLEHPEVKPYQAMVEGYGLGFDLPQGGSDDGEKISVPFCQRGGSHPDRLSSACASETKERSRVRPGARSSKLLATLSASFAGLWRRCFPAPLPTPETLPRNRQVLERENNSAPWDWKAGETSPEAITDMMKEAGEDEEMIPQECDWLDNLSEDPYYRGLQDKVRPDFVGLCRGAVFSSGCYMYCGPITPNPRRR